MSATLSPANGSVQIWCATLDKMAADQAATFLHPEETARAARYRFDQDRWRYQCARALLRLLLGRYLGLAAAEVRLRSGHHGKPALEQGGPLRFNLSHSYGEAVYAFTHSAEVGVDIEQVRDIPDADALAMSYFTDGERQTIENAGASKRMEAFYRCWTRKEAYVKGLGEGLSFPLLTVSLESGRCGRWTIQSFNAGPGFAAAVAVELPEMSIQLGRIHSLKELMGPLDAVER